MAPDAAPCSRPVIMISPNGEGSPACICEARFTNSLPNWPCDEEYGSLWQCIPKQWMQDPLWQYPPTPCNSDSGTILKWVEDDGTGQENYWTEDPITLIPIHVMFYPLRPGEECVTNVPVGAPAMPTGTYLGSLTVDQMNPTPAQQGQFFWPPVSRSML